MSDCITERKLLTRPRYNIIHKVQLTPLSNFNVNYIRSHNLTSPISTPLSPIPFQNAILSYPLTSAPRVKRRSITCDKVSPIKQIESTMQKYVACELPIDQKDNFDPWPRGFIESILSNDRLKIHQFLKANKLSTNEKKEIANKKNLNNRSLLFISSFKSI